MIDNLNKLQQLLDGFTRKLASVIAWSTLGMVLITALIIILRETFRVGWIAMQESVIYLHAAVFMLGSAYTLQQDEHVRVDVFYRKFSKKGKALANLFGTLFFLLPVAIYIFVTGFGYVASSWQILEASQESGGIPAVFILKSLILAFSTLMIMQGVAQIIKYGLVLLTKQEPES